MPEEQGIFTSLNPGVCSEGIQSSIACWVGPALSLRVSALYASPIHNLEFNYYLKSKWFKWCLDFPSIPAHHSSNFRANQIYRKEVYTHKYICYTSGNNSRTYPRAICATSDFCCLHIFRIQAWVRRQRSVLL